MRHWRAAILVAACLLNLLPYFVAHISGDSSFYMSRIACYGEQLWQGDFLPRWCFSGDAGMGNPVFLFSPPVPYLVPGIFYPLFGWAGASPYTMFRFGVAAATFVTAFGCWRWLKPLAGPNAALVGTVLYLFLPYRSEVLVFRSAYGELWVMAFAPYMAAAARDIVQGVRGGVLRLALSTALAMLSEGLVAVCVLMGLGVYVLAAGWRNWRAWTWFAAAMGLAGVLLLPYAIPAMRYMPFTQAEYMHEARPGYEDGYSGRFVLPLLDWKEGREVEIAGLAMTTLAFAGLAFAAWRGRQRMENAREALAWTIGGGFAFFMLFPFSWPLWWPVKLGLHIEFPWRMQLVLMMAVSLLGAQYLNMSGFGARKQDPGNMAVLWLLLGIMEACLCLVLSPRSAGLLQQMLAAREMCCAEFRTRWEDPAFTRWDGTDELAYYAAYKKEPRLEVLSGAAKVRAEHWSWRGIVLEADAPKESVIRIAHRYFPIWHAHASDGAAVKLQPETGDGFMLLSLPPGRHTVSVTMESLGDSVLGGAAQ